MRFFMKRRLRKKAEGLLHASRLARCMREDVVSRESLERLTQAEKALRVAVAAADPAAFEKAGSALCAAIQVVYPTPSHPVVREWVELIVVALAVAMGFRTYILQPFKIPTGSMQPTLYGIHYKPEWAPPLFRDFFPLRSIRFLITGEMPFEIRAKSGGRIYADPRVPERASEMGWGIGGIYYSIPKGLKTHVQPGETVVPGQLLASGIRLAGDHLFVNRIIWNFRRPRVGEVMVFSTQGMDPDQITPDTHYIKRLAGRPLDKLRIDPPMLYVNGKPTDQVPGMAKVVTRLKGYEFGYKDGRSLPGVRFLKNPDDEVTVPAGHYFGLGDNTTNSKDSRYFGAIPEEKLMGPALFVYWPLSWRWGLIE